jgi:hypothetical protein
MSSMLALRDAVVTGLQAEAGTGERFHGVKIVSHGGEFDTEAEVDRWAARAPALLVAMLKSDTETIGGEPWDCCVLGVFVVTVDRPGVMRDAAALTLASNVQHFLKQSPSPRWGLSTSVISKVIARNLYHEKFDKKGLALWGVFFEQSIKLEAPPAVVVEPPALESIHIQYDLSPRDNDADLGEVVDAEDIIDMVIATPEPGEPGELQFNQPVNSGWLAYI